MQMDMETGIGSYCLIDVCGQTDQSWALQVDVRHRGFRYSHYSLIEYF